MIPTAVRRCAGMRPGGERPAGFTLVELMVVLLILTMLATLSFIAWRSVLPSTELNSAVRELAGALYEARSDAIARNAEFQIEYYLDATDQQDQGFRIVTPYRLGDGGGLAFANEERFARNYSELPSSVSFQSITVDGKEYKSGMVSVRFDPLGAASDHIIVLVQPEYENYYTIEILALTGMIRFHKGIYTREIPGEGDFL